MCVFLDPTCAGPSEATSPRRRRGSSPGRVSGPIYACLPHRHGTPGPAHPQIKAGQDKSNKSEKNAFEARARKRGQKTNAPTSRGGQKTKATLMEAAIGSCAQLACPPVANE